MGLVERLLSLLADVFLLQDPFLSHSSIHAVFIDCSYGINLLLLGLVLLLHIKRLLIHDVSHRSSLVLTELGGLKLFVGRRTFVTFAILGGVLYRLVQLLLQAQLLRLVPIVESCVVPTHLDVRIEVRFAHVIFVETFLVIATFVKGVGIHIIPGGPNAILGVRILVRREFFSTLSDPLDQQVILLVNSGSRLLRDLLIVLLVVQVDRLCFDPDDLGLPFLLSPSILVLTTIHKVVYFLLSMPLHLFIGLKEFCLMLDTTSFFLERMDVRIRVVASFSLLVLFWNLSLEPLALHLHVPSLSIVMLVRLVVPLLRLLGVPLHLVLLLHEFFLFGKLQHLSCFLTFFNLVKHFFSLFHYYI
mmetsp:Transcript_10345/g.10370  ORF Transcript_10345/g.10370 Transcript_10345/m.10370 type:complete len:359 (-) Transcript_10345:175-1251(-)